ncbi:MAG: DUF5103 domain-containing protein [Balneolaceae bacterium]
MVVSCAPGISNAVKSPTEVIQTPSLLIVPGQLKAPQSIQSIQLYRKGFVSNPPIIELGTNNKLVLSFDELAAVSGQFRIQFSHHNKNWEESGLPEPWVFEGNNELFLRGGERNLEFKPDYFHYNFEFPNRDLKFNLSGHYLVHVYDYQSGIELFSIPFFVTENKGELETEIETIFNQGTNGNTIDQIFGEFIYPDFIEFPQFDLSYSFVQNRFWKKAKNVDQTSFTTKGKTEFHLSRANSFNANFDFSSLNLSELSLQNPQIYNFEPNRIPQRVTLKDDVLNFLADSRFVSDPEFGFPSNDRSARYTEVFFRFNNGGRTSNSSPVFLIGGFNQWSISDRYKLEPNIEQGVFETSALIKEGRYSYKYVTVENGEINDLKLSDSLTKRGQEYIAFVYYRDPQYQYDRLIKTTSINSFY